MSISISRLDLGLDLGSDLALLRACELLLGLGVHRAPPFHVVAGLARFRGLVRQCAAELVVDVVDRRIGPVFRVQLETIPFPDQTRYLAVRIIQITESQGSGLASIDAGRGGIAIDARLSVPFSMPVSILSTQKLHFSVVPTVCG